VDLHLGWNEAIAGEARWLDELVEQASQQAGGKVARERIREIALESAARYAGARISAFVPVLVGRAVRERLKEELQRTRQQG
jgi:hypothetical protein